MLTTNKQVRPVVPDQAQAGLRPQASLSRVLDQARPGQALTMPGFDQAGPRPQVFCASLVYDHIYESFLVFQIAEHILEQSFVDFKLTTFIRSC